MKRFLTAFLLTLFFLPSQASASLFDMILVGDPVLEDMRFLSLEAGRPILSFTLPLSPHEARAFLDSIDESGLSAPALEAYSRASRRLSPQPPRLHFSSELFSAFVGVSASFEARARANRRVAWHPRHPDVPPVASFPVRLFIGSFMQLYIEPAWKMSPTRYQRAGSIATNMPFDYFQYDHLMPHRAFLAAGGRMWNFQIGRDRLSWGTGHMGSLSISDSPDFYDFMRLSFFAGVFRFSSMVIQMPLDIRHGLLCGSVFPDSAVPEGHLYRAVSRHLYMHRLDVMLFNSLAIGIMEGVMVGDSPLELRFLNPIMIFHQMIPWVEYGRWGGREAGKDGHMVGPFFSVEANWNVIRSLSVYGQFAMTQYELPGELEGASHPSPDGLGYLAGIQYSHSFGAWAAALFFEFVHTSPFLYMHPSPFASFIHMRLLLFDPPRYSFIGFPRDLMMFTLGARFFRNDELSVSGVFSLLFNGERGIRYDWQACWSARGERTPTGAAERQAIATVSARWRPLPFLAVRGSLTGIHSRNNAHIPGAREAGLQAAFSAGVSF